MAEMSDLHPEDESQDQGAPEAGAAPATVSRAGGPGRDGRKRRRLLLLLLLLGLFTSGSATAVWYSVTKLPITSLPGVKVFAKGVAPRYVFSITGMTAPEAVAVSPDGQQIYVAESGGDRLVRVFDRDGKARGTMSPPGTDVGYRLPMGIAVAPDGKIFVSDRLRKAIDMFTPAGDYYGAYRPEALWDEPWFPLGLSFDAAGRFLVTDHRDGKHRVMVFRPNEYLDTSFGEQGEGPGQFSFPAIAVADSQGRVYVSDSNNSRLAVMDNQGKLLSIVTTMDPKTGLGLPRGLAVDRDDRVYVADAGSHVVAVYEAGDTPTYLFSFGDLGIGGGEFRYPNSIAVDRQGWIYVADRGNNSIQVWSY